METAGTRRTLERDFFPFVQKPMQYAGGEINSIRKDRAGLSLQGVLCFPETYEIGMSHYGGQILYHIVNKRPSWALSRCYHPWTDAEQIMRSRHIPLFSLEYLAPVKDADWIGFSVNYELQYTNLVNMLDLAGLPVYSRDRTAVFPLVIAGGPVMGNPEPLADFVDAFVVGDGEEAVVSICQILERSKRGGAAKPDILKAMENVDGVYVPSLREVKRSGMFLVPAAPQRVVRAAKVPELADDFYPALPIVPLVNVVHHRLVVEVLRGCCRGCRFCAAGFSYRPVRERPVQSILSQLKDGFAATGWREAGLLSLSTADYSGLTPLLCSAAEFSKREHVSLSLPSTRIDALTEADLDALQAIAPLSSFTIAPEAGTQRLRNVINKGFSDTQVMDTVSMLLKRNVQTIKLYFMIGLPTETDDDIAGIVRLATDIAGAAWRYSHRVSINVALSPFSPKPHTPFQWDAMDTRENLHWKSTTVKNALARQRNVKTSYRDPAMAFLETALARGDRGLSACIHAAWEAGARFDGWDEHFDLGRWKNASVKSGTDLEKFCGALRLDQPLPWSGVSTGVSVAFLQEERARAAKGETTTDCRTGSCSGCGVCGPDKTPAARQAVSGLPPSKTPSSATTAPVRSSRRHCFRFLYRKEPAIRFLGHLDMVGIFHRALHAACVPLAFSEGCRPHPLIAFGPPLPLGIAGRAEMFDAVMREQPSDLCAEVNRRLPQGLAIVDFEEIPAQHASLSADICSADYLFEPLGAPLPQGFTAESLDAAIRAFLSGTEALVTVLNKGRTSGKNVRPLVHSLTSNERTDGPPSFSAVLSMGPGKTCKPQELLTALFPGLSSWDFLSTRKECLRQDLNLFRPVWAKPPRTGT
jgi:radical SAM family uncharacterized protein/radical SAM-linked protein